MLFIFPKLHMIQEHHPLGSAVPDRPCTHLRSPSTSRQRAHRQGGRFCKTRALMCACTPFTSAVIVLDVMTFGTVRGRSVGLGVPVPHIPLSEGLNASHWPAQCRLSFARGYAAEWPKSSALELLWAPSTRAVPAGGFGTVQIIRIPGPVPPQIDQLILLHC